MVVIPDRVDSDDDDDIEPIMPYYSPQVYPVQFQQQYGPPMNDFNNMSSFYVDINSVCCTNQLCNSYINKSDNNEATNVFDTNICAFMVNTYNTIISDNNTEYPVINTSISRKPRVYASKLIEAMHELKFKWDNGCVSGSLITSPEAFQLLGDETPSTGTFIQGATHRVPATYVGRLPLVGLAYYAPINTVNLLSLDAIEALGCEYHTANNTLIITYHGTVILRSCKDPNSKHYHSTYFELMRASIKLDDVATKRMYMASFSSVLNDIRQHNFDTNSQQSLSKTTSTNMHKQLLKSPNHLTQQELLRAQQANTLHHIVHCNDDILSEALDHGVYSNCNLTSQDLHNARLIYGPCSACYEGKATVPRATSASLREESYRIGELLHVDLFSYDNSTIGGNTTRIECIEHNTELILIASIKSKSEEQIIEGLKSIISFYDMHDHIVKYISSDAESSILKCKVQLASIGIEVLSTTPGLHESLSERMKRTLSERVSTILADLPYELPKKLYGELYNYAADIINNLPNKQTPHSCPYSIVTGLRPSMPLYRFGQPGIFYHRSFVGTRADYGIIVGYTNDMHHKYRVYFALTQSIRKCGEFQSMQFISNEWMWPARLRYGPTRGRRPSQLTNFVPFQPDMRTRNVNIQSGEPIKSDQLIQHSMQHEDNTNQEGTYDIAHDISTNSDDMSTPSDAVQPSGSIVSNELYTTVPAGVLDSTNTAQSDSTNTPVVQSQSQPPTSTVQVQHKYATRASSRAADIETMYNNIVSNTLYSYKLSVKKSLISKYAVESENAIYDEFMNMKTNNVLLPVLWSSLSADERSHIIPAHMFLKEKFKANGEFDKIKGRIVAGGDQQDEDTYDNIASPTINSIVILALINIFTVLNMFVLAIDIKHAFLKVPTNPLEKHPIILLRPDLVQLQT
jgi:hypothetical protein